MWMLPATISISLNAQSPNALNGMTMSVKKLQGTIIPAGKPVPLVAAIVQCPMLQMQTP